MNHPATKYGLASEHAAVASDMRKAAFEAKIAPELAGVEAMVREIAAGAKEAVQNIKLRVVIERAQIILAHASLPPGPPGPGISAIRAVVLLHALLDGPETREAMGEN